MTKLPESIVKYLPPIELENLKKHIAEQVCEGVTIDSTNVLFSEILKEFRESGMKKNVFSEKNSMHPHAVYQMEIRKVITERTLKILSSLGLSLRLVRNRQHFRETPTENVTCETD